MSQPLTGRYSEHRPDALQIWGRLRKHAQTIADWDMREAFLKDPERFSRFSLEFGDLLVDYSKNLLTQETLDMLLELARDAGVETAREAMFNGERMNWTENRAVLHVALRRRSSEPLLFEGHDVMPEVRGVLEKMRGFVNDLRSGRLPGATGKSISAVVNIGIGGSDLGPVMISEALRHYQDGPELRFISNVDATDFVEKTRDLDPEQTLFIVASKSFRTEETMTNAHTARSWLLEVLQDERAIEKHFVAISTNSSAVREFGISSERQFEFWDWVGGRFSSWSAIGLSIAIGIGFEAFEEFLSGAYEMDEHFRREPFDRNIPVILAMLGIWYRNFVGAPTHAILPYDQYLHRFAAYFQQADMESNGKSIDRDGAKLEYSSGPVIWGEPGTNGQHAFFQLIHQGTQLVPCDFIGFIQSLNPVGDHHRKLMANFLAQTEALMRGRRMEEIEEECPEELRPYKFFPGNRPTTTILLEKLTPRSLGKIMAMYEHKIFVQGVVWRINSFDQWGVELGKELAKNILPEAEALSAGDNPDLSHHDSSTEALMRRIFAPR